MAEYHMRNNTTWKEDKNGQTQIANFEARITEELRYVDGKQHTTVLTIGGIDSKGSKFPPVTITAEKFQSMSWITGAWGINAIVQPGHGSKEDLRTAIQMNSEGAERRYIYTHTGWTRIEGEDAFLTASGAITKRGLDKSIIVELSAELSRYALPNPTGNVRDAVRDSLHLRKLGPAQVLWPMLAATYRSAIGESDFAIHVTGRTGTFKSEVASLMQSHFGERMDSRHLPGSWSSTANALEAQAYKAKDALFTIDDFIPLGTSWQIKQYQKTADQIIRGQGNQAGRARLTDTSNLQTTMYPRGLVLSTGEDTPEGHSVRARMIIAELDPGTIDPAKLTEAQAKRPSYPLAMAAFIQWLAKDLKKNRQAMKKLADETRDANISVGHSRTPPTLGQLLAGVFEFLVFAAEIGAIEPQHANTLWNEAQDALTKLAESQQQYLTAADPTEHFLTTLRSILAIPAGHLKSRNGGIPDTPTSLGWNQTSNDGEMPSFRCVGPRLGWVDKPHDMIYLDANVTYDTVRRHSRGQITITKHTLFKRLREAGHLTKVDDTRKRNTIRVTCEHSTRQCLAMSLSKVLQDEGVD